MAYKLFAIAYFAWVVGFAISDALNEEWGYFIFQLVFIPLAVYFLIRSFRHGW